MIEKVNQALIYCSILDNMIIIDDQQHTRRQFGERIDETRQEIGYGGLAGAQGIPQAGI